MFAAKQSLVHCALQAVVLRSLALLSMSIRASLFLQALQLCCKFNRSLALFSKFFQTALFLQASQPLLLDTPVPLLVIVTAAKCVG